MNNEYTLPLENQKRIAWAALRNYSRALRQAHNTTGIIELQNMLHGFIGSLRQHNRKA